MWERWGTFEPRGRHAWQAHAPAARPRQPTCRCMQADACESFRLAKGAARHTQFFLLGCCDAVGAEPAPLLEEVSGPLAAINPDYSDPLKLLHAIHDDLVGGRARGLGARAQGARPGGLGARAQGGRRAGGWVPEVWNAAGGVYLAAAGSAALCSRWPLCHPWAGPARAERAGPCLQAPPPTPCPPTLRLPAPPAQRVVAAASVMHAHLELPGTRHEEVMVTLWPLNDDDQQPGYEGSFPPMGTGSHAMPLKLNSVAQRGYVLDSGRFRQRVGDRLEPAVGLLYTVELARSAAARVEAVARSLHGVAAVSSAADVVALLKPAYTRPAKAATPAVRAAVAAVLLHAQPGIRVGGAPLALPSAEDLGAALAAAGAQ